MKHAFLMNCHLHNDVAQAMRNISFCVSRIPTSQFYVFYDGHPRCPSTLATLDPWVVQTITTEYEPDKAISLNDALTVLGVAADRHGVEVATFMHPDMIPTNEAAFHLFLKRFWHSGKAMTYTSMWPNHPFISFTCLTFNVRRAFELGILPVQNTTKPGGPLYCNEQVFTDHLNLRVPGWRDHTYKLWNIVYPYTGMAPEGSTPKVGHRHDQYFVINDICPETSMVHTHDPRFWDNMELFCK